MQRCSIELGAFHDEHPGREFIFEGAVAAFCACRVGRSACYLWTYVHTEKSDDWDAKSVSQKIHSLIHRRSGTVFFVLSLIPFLLVLWLLRKGDVHTREPK